MANVKKSIIACILACIAFGVAAQEWSLETTLLSTLRYGSAPFVDSGWGGDSAGGLKIPIELQVAVWETDSLILTANAGISFGAMPSGLNWYLGCTAGIRLYWTALLEGFSCALYPVYDLIFLWDPAHPRWLDWQAAIDILSFELQLGPTPIVVGGYFRCALVWLSGSFCPVPEAGMTLGLRVE